MLYEFGLVVFCLIAILLILFVVVQQSQGGFFSGPSNSDSTIIFGGNAGSTIFQKISWVLGFSFIILGFSLSLYRTHLANKSMYKQKNAKVEEVASLNTKTENTENK